MTRVIEVSPDQRGGTAWTAALDAWEQALAAGGVSAFATDTVWGVGARADRDDAIERLYAAKGRDPSRPLACLVASASAARRWAADWPATVERLARRHWPGPLTIVVPTDGIPFPALQRGVATLGLRVPDRPLVLDLLDRLDVPLAASSANLSGRPELDGDAAIARAFGDAIDLVVSDTSPVTGVASTVVQWDHGGWVVLRRGGVSVRARPAPRRR